MKIVENDIRLLRRILVARQVGEPEAINVLIQYLRHDRELKFILPEEQTLGEKEMYFRRLPANELWLATAFGAIFLTDQREAIFLNSQWANPRTLYVRLTAPVAQLGVYGEVYWVPKQLASGWDRVAERHHANYMAGVPMGPPDDKPLWQQFKEFWRW